LSIGKKKEEIEEFINSGVYQVARLKEEGWITDLLYDDEVLSFFAPLPPPLGHVQHGADTAVFLVYLLGTCSFA